LKVFDSGDKYDMELREDLLQSLKKTKQEEKEEVKQEIHRQVHEQMENFRRKTSKVLNQQKFDVDAMFDQFEFSSPKN
jgi:ElaB/YqjD/DUF883 family membrane-anchored ribosome-binding protein